MTNGGKNDNSLNSWYRLDFGKRLSLRAPILTATIFPSFSQFLNVLGWTDNSCAACRNVNNSGTSLCMIVSYLFLLLFLKLLFFCFKFEPTTYILADFVIFFKPQSVYNDIFEIKKNEPLSAARSSSFALKPNLIVRSKALIYCWE